MKPNLEIKVTVPEPVEAQASFSEIMEKLSQLNAHWRAEAIIILLKTFQSEGSSPSYCQKRELIDEIIMTLGYLQKD